MNPKPNHQLTIFGKPNGRIKTTRETITYLAWCEREATRIAALPLRAAEVRRRGADCAVFVNRVSG